jgi:hypothetical protein
LRSSGNLLDGRSFTGNGACGAIGPAPLGDCRMMSPRGEQKLNR